MNPRRGNKRRRSIIHIVDDDAAVGDSMRALLGVHGIEAVHHATAKEFLKNAGSIDDACLVIDFHLRELDGIELVKRLRADGISAPVILTSSNVGPALLKRVMALEGVEVVAKPLDEDGFISLVERVRAQPD